MLAALHPAEKAGAKLAWDNEDVYLSWDPKADFEKDHWSGFPAVPDFKTGLWIRLRCRNGYPNCLHNIVYIEANPKGYKVTSAASCKRLMVDARCHGQ